MTLAETTELLTPLALAMRVDFDEPTFKAYAAMLIDVPAELAALALEQLREGGMRFFPTAPEIQAQAERVRRQLVIAHPWVPCAECEDHPRFRAVLIDGIERMEPCPCLQRHREVLKERGWLEPIAVLPSEVGAGDERVYPTIDQLPTKLRQRFSEVSRQKVLR